MKPVLLATDGSPTSQEAATVAMELAADSGRPLLVVTVCDVSSSTLGYGLVPALPDFTYVLEERASEILEEAAATSRANGLEVETVMLRGFPADEVCRLAAERDAKLVVVGSHGWGPVKRLLFGSVSNDILHQALCPVLVVPGSERADGAGDPEREEGRSLAIDQS